MDSPLSLALLHDAMVVVVIKTHHNHGLVFSVHCMAIYVIRNFTGRSPIISFKQISTSSFITVITVGLKKAVWTNVTWC